MPSFYLSRLKDKLVSWNDDNVWGTYQWPVLEQWPHPDRKSPRTDRRQPALLHPPTLWAPSGTDRVRWRVRKSSEQISSAWLSSAYHCMALTLWKKKLNSREESKRCATVTKFPQSNKNTQQTKTWAQCAYVIQHQHMGHNLLIT